MKAALSVISLLLLALAQEPAFAATRGGNHSCLYDGGLPNLGTYGSLATINTVAGVSDYAAGPFERNTVLDDFTVPRNETWSLKGLSWYHHWYSGSSTVEGADVEISLRHDDFGTPGSVFVPLLNVTSYQETATGRFKESVALFDPVVLSNGTYWFEATIVGPERNFWHSADLKDNEAWMNSNDYGGFQSISNSTGSMPLNLNFCLLGSPVGDESPVGDSSTSSLPWGGTGWSFWGHCVLFTSTMLLVVG